MACLSLIGRANMCFFRRDISLAIIIIISKDFSQKL
jgi:hypothetical protein